MRPLRLAVVVALLGAAFAACDLNPQPLPPGDESGKFDPGRAAGFGDDSGTYDAAKQGEPQTADAGPVPPAPQEDGGGGAGDAAADADAADAADGADAADARDAIDAGDAADAG